MLLDQNAVLQLLGQINGGLQQMDARMEAIEARIGNVEVSTSHLVEQMEREINIQLLSRID